LKVAKRHARKDSRRFPGFAVNQIHYGAQSVEVIFVRFQKFVQECQLHKNVGKIAEFCGHVHNCDKTGGVRKIKESEKSMWFDLLLIEPAMEPESTLRV
jgi:hypothetical protein